MTGQREPKLPVRQLTILALCRFAEPIASTSVNPYLPEMMSFFVPPSSVARWAGIAASVFSLAQCLTAVWWGRASDRFGRKPTIILSLFNTLITTILWGFSTSLPMAIVVRAIAGAGNGNVGVIRTAVAELVPWKELQPMAFSIMPLVWNVGSVLGPALGGALANPLHIQPEEDGRRGMREHGSLLERFPFAAPAILSATLFITSLTNCIFLLEEPLAALRNRYDPGLAVGHKIIRFVGRRIHSLKNSLQQQRGKEEEPLLKPAASSGRTPGNDEFDDQVKEALHTSRKPMSYRDVLTYQSILNLFTYTILATHSVGFDQLIPVYLHQEQQDPSDPDVSPPFYFKGGFQISSQTIGLLLSIYGIFALFVQFLVFPPIARKYGVLRVFQICSFVFPIVYLITPFTALLPSSITAAGPPSNAMHPAADPASGSYSAFALPFNVVILLLVMLCKCTAAVFALPCTTILLTNSASSLAVLATLNGIATSVSAIGRAAGPAIGGNLLGWGVKRSLAWLPWWVFAAISVVGAVASLWLVEGEGFGAEEDEGAENDDADTETDNDGQDGDPRDRNYSKTTLDGHSDDHRSPLTPQTTSTSQHPDERKLGRVRTASSTILQDIPIEEESEDVESSVPSPSASRPSQRRSSITLSAPIGMRKPISRKLSSKLGQSLGSQHSFGG